MKQTNKELSTTVSKLQQLEKNDLPGIEETLKEFIRNNGIRYAANKDSNLVESILGLVSAISIHVSSQNRSVQPFLDELQRLRTAFSQPFIERLQYGSDIDTATNQAVIQVLRSDKLVQYLETIVVNALQSSGAGEKIGKNTVDSLSQKDLLDDSGTAAFKQTLAETLKSKPVREALEYAVGNEMTEYGITTRIVKVLMHQFKTGLQDSDPELIAFKNALAEALKSEGVSKKLNDALCNALTDPNLAKEFAKVLQKPLSEKL